MTLEQAERPQRHATYDVFETRIGWVAVVGSAEGVSRTSLPEPSREQALGAVASAIDGAVLNPDALAPVRDLIVRYCAGERIDLSSVNVDLKGASTFFTKAWQACKSIPAGETRTYAWLAESAGSPAAARGAGQAMARNPVPLLVPCHRVVGSDGGLHGFGGTVGLPLKQRLLAMEASARSAAR